MAFESLEQIVTLCEERKQEFWEVVLNDDVQERGVTKEESWEKMCATWDAILLSVATYEGDVCSPSGLTGGDGKRMEEYLKNSTGIKFCGDFVGTVIARALQMGESNACMKRIVAAPTAGACGVLPAVLVPCFQQGLGDVEQILKSMYVAAGIGQVIAARASISGAQGGCQAEIGSASAMAAGALVYLGGGGAKEIIHGAAMCLKNLLGLVCDPVAGLVEVPCIKRNVIGAVNSLSCADMALAGIISRIPPDQVIDAMKEIGDKMDNSLKETALGGLAATPAAREFEENISQKSN